MAEILKVNKFFGGIKNKQMKHIRCSQNCLMNISAVKNVSRASLFKNFNLVL